MDILDSVLGLTLWVIEALPIVALVCFALAAALTPFALAMLRDEDAHTAN